MEVAPPVISIPAFLKAAPSPSGAPTPLRRPTEPPVRGERPAGLGRVEQPFMLLDGQPPELLGRRQFEVGVPPGLAVLEPLRRSFNPGVIRTHAASIIRLPGSGNGPMGLFRGRHRRTFPHESVVLRSTAYGSNLPPRCLARNSSATLNNFIRFSGLATHRATRALSRPTRDRHLGAVPRNRPVTAPRRGTCAVVSYIGCRYPPHISSGGRASPLANSPILRCRTPTARSDRPGVWPGTLRRP